MEVKISNGGGGFGPAAWGGDSQKVSLHPPIPGHIEFVEEQMKLNQKKHHIVQRRHPENDNEVIYIRRKISPEDMDHHFYLLNRLINMCQRKKAHMAAAKGELKVCASKDRILHHQHPDREREIAAYTAQHDLKNEA